MSGCRTVGLAPSYDGNSVRGHVRDAVADEVGAFILVGPLAGTVTNPQEHGGQPCREQRAGKDSHLGVVEGR